MSIRQYIILAFLFTSGVLVVGQLYGAIPLTGSIAAQFDVDPRAATWVGSAFGVGYAPGFLLFGALTDRFGCRRTAVIGLFLLALATIIVAEAHTFSALLAARVVQGVCASSFAPAALAMIPNVLPLRHRPIGLSLVSLSFLTAAPIAQLAVVRLGEPLPRLMLQVAPVYAVLGAALTLACPVIPPPKPSGEIRRSSVALLARTPGIISVWLASGTVLFAFVAFQSTLQTFGRAMGVDPQLVRLTSMPLLAATLVAAHAIHKAGAPKTAQAGIVAMLLAFVSASVGLAPSLFAAGALLELGVALAIPGMIATLVERTPQESRGLGIGIYACILFLGASISPPLTDLVSHLRIPFSLVPISCLGIATVLLAGVARTSETGASRGCSAGGRSSTTVES